MKVVLSPIRFKIVFKPQQVVDTYLGFWVCSARSRFDFDQEASSWHFGVLSRTIAPSNYEGPEAMGQTTDRGVYENR